MKTIVILSLIIYLTNASQIYHDEYQTSSISQHQLPPDTSQYQLNQNFQINNVLNRARILNYESDKTDYGYRYGFETDNGIRTQEAGQYRGKTHTVQGAYSYTGDDGLVYTVTYTADENGFHPQGAHLPTPPPTPEVILKSLERNAQDEANGIFDDGSYKKTPNQYGSQQLRDQYQLSQTQYQSTSGDQNAIYEPTGSIEAYQAGSNVKLEEGDQFQQGYQNAALSGSGHY